MRLLSQLWGDLDARPYAGASGGPSRPPVLAMWRVESCLGRYESLRSLPVSPLRACSLSALFLGTLGRRRPVHAPTRSFPSAISLRLVNIPCMRTISRYESLALVILYLDPTRHGGSRVACVLVRLLGSSGGNSSLPPRFQPSTNGRSYYRCFLMVSSLPPCHSVDGPARPFGPALSREQARLLSARPDLLARAWCHPVRFALLMVKVCIFQTLTWLTI